MVVQHSNYTIQKVPLLLNEVEPWSGGRLIDYWDFLQWWSIALVGITKREKKTALWRLCWVENKKKSEPMWPRSSRQRQSRPRRGKSEAEVKLGLCNVDFGVDREGQRVRYPMSNRYKNRAISQIKTLDTQHTKERWREDNRGQKQREKPHWREMAKADKIGAHTNMSVLPRCLVVYFEATRRNATTSHTWVKHFFHSFLFPSPCFHAWFFLSWFLLRGCCWTSV